jgi:hypothetical protein
MWLCGLCPHRLHHHRRLQVGPSKQLFEAAEAAA